MRSLDVTERNGEIEARLVEIPAPVPAAGEVLLRVAGSGVNRADLMQAAGHYPAPAGEPSIPGLEVSGIVEGSGERVCAILAGGGHAELVAAPAGQVFPAPRTLDLVDAAAIPEVFLTAFVNLVIEGTLRAGETLLVHAGASGVGLAAIALGKRLGARVASTTRSNEKLPAMRRAGADFAVETDAGDFGAAIEKEWGAGCVDVVLDPIGAGSLPGDLRLLATGGRVVFIATMSGSRAEVDLAVLMRRRARLIGSMLRSRSRAEKAAIVRRFAGEVLPAFDAGELAVTVDSTVAPEDAAKAFTRMRENRNVGKILIAWNRP